MRQITITRSITNRGSISLDKYLLDIGKMDMISFEEESTLSRAIHSGDKKALDALVRANLRFVVSVAKQYQYQGMALCDLINEGNLGLIHAARRFDESRGFKFISYAVWWIRQSIMQALAEKARMVRLPSNRVSLGHKAQKAYSLLEQMHERMPSDEELATEMSIPVGDLRSVLDYHINYVSLDSPHPVTGEETMGDRLIDHNKSNNADDGDSLQKDVKRCLATLSERDRDIVCSFFGIGMPEALSLNEIGTKYNMSGERVRQIRDKALKYLRSPAKSNLLREYICA